jgi:CBS domain-containing protein
MKIKNIMTPNVETIRPTCSVREAAEKMKQLEIGVLPVCDEERLLGIVTDRDIVLRCVSEGGDPGHAVVEEIMSRNVITCAEDDSVEQAAHLMENYQIRRLVVLDANKKVVGIISLGDIAVDSGDEDLSGEVLTRVCESNRPNKERIMAGV